MDNIRLLPSSACGDVAFVVNMDRTVGTSERGNRIVASTKFWEDVTIDDKTYSLRLTLVERRQKNSAR